MAITWRELDVIMEKKHIFDEAIMSYKNNKKFRDILFESIFSTTNLDKSNLEFCESEGCYFTSEGSSIFTQQRYNEFYNHVIPNIDEYCDLVLSQLRIISRDIEKCKAMKWNYNKDKKVRDEKQERINIANLYYDLDALIGKIGCGTADMGNDYDFMVDVIRPYARANYNDREYFGYYA